MKIGILTLHCAHNYGAMLQSYALKHCLQEQGHDVKIIDYRPKHVINPYRLFPSFSGLSWKNKINVLIYILLYFPYRYIRYSRFNRFLERYLIVDDVYYKTADAIQWFDFDVCFYGSDQIWNLDITKNDFTYLGETNNIVLYKISYAASMGRLFEKDFPIYQKYLDMFDCISVREKSMKKSLQPLTEKPIHTVLDPTLLLDADNWRNLAVSPRLKKKYVLLYQIYYDKKLRLFAEKIAAKRKAVVVELTAGIPLTYQRYRDPIASPEEFVGYFKNAECVVTTSFHGLAFSLIFKKEFFILDVKSLPSGLNSRIYSLLESLGLLSRFLRREEDAFSIDVLDYSVVSSRLDELRTLSFDFIKKSLKLVK